MTNELQTVGAMHQCRAGEPYSTCVHCGALAEALNKPCPHFMRDAAKKLSTVVPTPQADSAPASLAGPMQFGGCPECGSRTCVARQCSRTVSHAAQALPGGVQWQCGPQASGFTAPQADSQPAPQGETDVQLDIDSNPSTPGQQRDVAGTVALGQPVGDGPDQAAGHTGAQGNKLLIVAERNLRSFLRNAAFKSESDREAALNCVDVLWEAARAPADSVTAPAATVIKKGADRQWMSERLGHLPDGIYSLYLAPPAQAASSAVLKAIRAANMQLVRTGDDEFMLVTYKNAKAQCDGGKCGIGGYCDDCPAPQADSQQAPEYVGNGMFKGETIQKAAEHWANWCDVRSIGGVAEFLRVVAATPAFWTPEEIAAAKESAKKFEPWLADTDRAARAPADSVLEDADPLQGAANWLAEAHGQFCVAVLQGCLMIGYNRAKRLHDAAIAARKQGGAT